MSDSPGAQPYPYVTVRFCLEIDGAPWCDFAECSGLSMETATEEFAEGGENRFAYRFPTRGQVPNLVLKRGMTASRSLWDWYYAFIASANAVVTPKNGTIKLLGVGDDILRAWSFRRAYPVKWTGPDLNAASPGVAFETLELVHLGIWMVEPAS